MRVFNAAGRFAGAILCLGACYLPTAAVADSLESVLSSTYLSNPELQAERANLRATDENMPQARSGLRPQVGLSANVGGERVSTRAGGASSTYRNSFGGYTLSVTQPIFRGFRTLNTIRQVDAQILAERENLRLLEQQVLASAVTAFMDVIRDRAILRLRQQNVGVLAEQLRATKDRFDVGEVTKTDVAQARASHSGAVSALNLAKANLKSSRAVFEQVIGYPPNGLSKPRSIMSLIANTLDEALRRGMEEHPSIIAAVYNEVAATRAVDIARGQFLPSIDLEGSYTKSYNPSQSVDQIENSTIQGTLTWPLYQGGLVHSEVRQAKQVVLQMRENLSTARKSVRAEVIASWGLVSSTKAQIIADRTQVSANKTALDGVREEEKVGQRTVLDVLNAQQTLLNSQVALTTSEHDLVVATFRLLAATGRLSAFSLGLKVQRYIPEEHYDRVKRKWFGTRVEEYNEDDFAQRALVEDRYFPETFK